MFYLSDLVQLESYVNLPSIWRPRVFHLFTHIVDAHVLERSGRARVTAVARSNYEAISRERG